MFIKDKNGNRVYRYDGYVEPILYAKTYKYEIRCRYWYGGFTYSDKDIIEIDYDIETKEGLARFTKYWKDKKLAMRTLTFELDIKRIN